MWTPLLICRLVLVLGARGAGRCLWGPVLTCVLFSSSPGDAA